MALSAPIAVTMGEPAGIGGEVILKAWQARRSTDPTFFVIDDPRRLTEMAASLKLSVKIKSITAPAAAAREFRTGLPVLALPEMTGVKVTPGTPSIATAKAVVAAIDRAVALARAGDAAAMVTLPIHKETLQADGFGFPGHTEYLGHLAGDADAVMMLGDRAVAVAPDGAGHHSDAAARARQHAPRAKLTTGPAIAIRNSALGLGGSARMCATPPNKNSVIWPIGMR